MTYPLTQKHSPGTEKSVLSFSFACNIPLFVFEYKNKQKGVRNFSQKFFSKKFHFVLSKTKNLHHNVSRKIRKGFPMKENLYVVNDVMTDINSCDSGELAISVIYKRYNSYDIENPLTIFDDVQITNAKVSFDEVNSFVVGYFTFPSEDDENITVLENIWYKYHDALKKQNASSISIPMLEFYFATAKNGGSKMLLAAQPILMIRTTRPGTKDLSAMVCLFDVAGISVIETAEEDFASSANGNESSQMHKEVFKNIVQESGVL